MRMLALLSKIKALAGNLTGLVLGFLTALLTFWVFILYIETISALGEATWPSTKVLQ